MKILLTVTSLLPAYGGPARSVSRLAAALAHEGVEVALWAADGSARETGLLPAEAPVERLPGGERAIMDRLEGIDLLHDNGIWLRHNHRLAAIARERNLPRIVSIRGMLEPWARRHKRWKKDVAWYVYQRRDLKNADCHHASGEPEAANIRLLGLRVPVRVIPNGVDLPARSRAPGSSGRSRRRALFLGRLYPIKGLPMLIRAWEQSRPSGWELVIAGPDEAGHQKRLEKIVAAARLGDVVSFVGPLDGDAKSRLLFDSDLFVLPSHSESFGMSIAEALAHGLPVLTTTGTPWADLQERDCGWLVHPDADALAQGLRCATELEPARLRRMGESGREFVRTRFDWRQVTSSFIGLYCECLGLVRRMPE